MRKLPTVMLYQTGTLVGRVILGCGSCLWSILFALDGFNTFSKAPGFYDAMALVAPEQMWAAWFAIHGVMTLWLCGLLVKGEHDAPRQLAWTWFASTLGVVLWIGEMTLTTVSTSQGAIGITVRVAPASAGELILSLLALHIFIRTNKGPQWMGTPTP